MSRKLALGSPHGNATDAEKIEHLQGSMRLIQQASHDIDPFDIADKFVVTNLTETRTFDADSTTLAEIADVLGTLIADLKKRGAKRI